MNKNKIRKYPPIIVSLAVGAIFMALAIHSAAIGAEHMQDYNRPTPGSTYTTFAAELPTTAYLAATQQAPEEKATEPEAEAESTYESMIKSRDWDSDDSERLMKIAMAEAESEGVEGKALVMLVVLNRVWSDDFPGTIEEVIFQPRQFSVVTEGGRYYTTEPDAECYERWSLFYPAGTRATEPCTSRAAQAAVGTAETSNFFSRLGTTNFTDRRREV